ncbi:MAG: hypothetical protein PUI41_11555 [Lachnospiraceae bacterium]|nr:hypothetical protein [Lachnospiraceae bacterium]MCI7595852.1 hypothetical protein [Lachnospiraceae bacterium]MDD7051531.1 hypothetical protein [Lachnospiraceae bacterium]MDY3223214.1 hypothetical protein [Lachnospiraceae bacterium]MDY4097331.1 hypothetical protein [Lachnospiraceae bacterium]
MINEKRVKLMTRMAAYEDGEFRRHKAVIGFFRSDYISLQMVKTVIATTIAYAILFGLYLMYDFEKFMKEIYQMDVFQFIKTVVILYLVMLAVFMLITYVVSLYRYNRSLQSTRLYYGNLKKLSQFYQEEE